VILVLVVVDDLHSVELETYNVATPVFLPFV